MAEGPRLVAFLICKSVNDNKDGSQNLTEVQNGVRAPMFPWAWTPAVYVKLANITTQVLLTIHVQRGSGGGPSYQRTLDPHSYLGLANITLWLPMTLPSEGAYWFSVEVDGVNVGDIPFSASLVDDADDALRN